MVSIIEIDSEAASEYPQWLYRFDHAAAKAPSLDGVTEEDIESYRRDGFLAVEHGLSSVEVTRSISALSDLVAHPSPDFMLQLEQWAPSDLDALDIDARLDVVRRLLLFSDCSPELKSIAYHPAIVSVAERIIRESVTMIQDMALLKPPGGGREKPWHQDKAFFNFDPSAPVVGVWIALDEATAANGCMHIIPGSHLDGAVDHFRRRDWQICDTSVRTDHDTMVPLAPGGLMFFDGYIHHGTPANRTDKRRRALQFHYAGVSTVRIDEEVRLAVFGGEGRGATC